MSSLVIALKSDPDIMAKEYNELFFEDLNIPLTKIKEINEENITQFIDQFRTQKERVSKELELYIKKYHSEFSATREEIKDLKIQFLEINEMLDKIKKKLHTESSNVQLENFKTDYKKFICSFNTIESELCLENLKCQDEFYERKTLFESIIKNDWLGSFEFNVEEENGSLRLDKIRFHANITDASFTKYLLIMRQINILPNTITIFGYIRLYNQQRGNFFAVLLSQLFLTQKELLDFLTEIFTFLNSIFQKNDQNNPEILTHVAYLIGTPHQHLLGISFYSELVSIIHTFINESNQDLSNFSLITKAAQLQTYLKESGFVDKNSTEIKDLFAIKILSDQEKHFNSLLNQARKLILDEDLSLITIEDSILSDFIYVKNILNLSHKEISMEKLLELHQSNNEFSTTKPVFHVKKCKIYKKTQNLLNFIINSFKKTSQNASSVTFIYQTIRDIFEMFLALNHLNINENSSLRYICIAHNDFYYLSNYCSILSFAFKSLLSTDTQFLSFADYSILFQQTVDDILNTSIKKQQDSISLFALEFLNLLKGSHDNFMSNNINSKIYQRLFQIKQLCFDVLPLDIFQQVMGSIISILFEKIYQSIVEMEDITEQESINMETTLPLLLDNIPQLMSSQNNDLIVFVIFYTQQFYATIKFLKRYVLLIKIIQSTMQEIINMWENDQNDVKSEIPSTDIINLLRSLFQNTKLRSDAINRIVSNSRK
ncbi:hypothetical protein HZS_1515, partial [Henneguya salminicola]